MSTAEKPGDHRITVHFLRTGQPHPYADTETVARIIFELKSWFSPHDWQPMLQFESRVRDLAPHMGIGFVSNSREAQEHWSDSYLDYLRPINPTEIGTASIWEFRSVSPYTD